jgi:hypothetical protein
MIPYCKAHGIGLIPYAPLAAGALAHPVGEETLRSQTTPFKAKLTDADKAIIGRVQELAEKKGCTMSQIALAVSQLVVPFRYWYLSLMDNAVDPAEGRLSNCGNVLCCTCGAKW